MDKGSSVAVDKTDHLQQEDGLTLTQPLCAVTNNVGSELAITGTNSVALLDAYGSLGEMAGADTAIVTTSTQQFACMKRQEGNVSMSDTEDEAAVVILAADNTLVNRNLVATEADAVSSKPAVELLNQFGNKSSSDVFSTDLGDKVSYAGLASVDFASINGIGGGVKIASIETKRAYEEEGEDATSRLLNPRKRVALQNNDSSVPNLAGQTTDETVGDSSDDVEMSEPMDKEEVLHNDSACANEEGKRVHEEFWCNLTIKQQVDVFDIRTKEWLAAKIKRFDNEGCTVRYMGWNSKCDEKNRKGQQLPNYAQSYKGPLRRGQNAKLSRRNKKKKDVKTMKSKFPEEDLCGVCGEIENDDLTDMILCDGGCLKSYHFSCLGIDSAPEGEEWLCEQCRTNEQLCFACGRNGTINEKGGVFCCSDPCCGKFFHQKCVDANKMSRRVENKVKPGFSSVKELPEFDALFRCPRHVCFVCEAKKKSSDLMCCLQCPEAYHPQCVPPSARYNTIGLLCWRHFDKELPKIPSFYFSDRNIDTVTVDSSLHLPRLFLPKREPDASKPGDCHHFRLLLSIIEDVRLQPPTYRNLGRSIYTFKHPRISLEDAPMCVCRKRCGDDCINRLSFTECFGPASTPGMKFNKQNRESNCMLGESCGNRALHQKVYPRFQKFHTVEKGWGLRVLEQVKVGQLVIEYVGEVINEEEKERRLLDHAKNSPEDKNMYIMELGKGEYIDARFKGSVSRFINHSCDPNCHLLKWRVKGVNRIAITALKDIEPGTELSYDYQFHTKQAMEWKCHCKAKNCRGTMAPDKINQAHEPPVKRLTKKEQVKQQKRALMHEKIQHDKEVKSTARRLSLTAQVSTGDRTTIDKMAVRTGPVARELQWAKYHHLFNVRNAKHGFNFKLRKELRDLRNRSHEKGVVKERSSRETSSQS
ncbi:unnamed protein product [Peronospora destructor]|uniref:Histone-lysine N-methyltransferase n=1 Tax=Peronospora destructor TaxID=86335 RepID=A0AAV0V8H1_9STRA|nr:unnamed protein product [Peronospora destructor]